MKKTLETWRSLRFKNDFVSKKQLAREVFVTKQRFMQWNYVREHDTRLFSGEL